MNWNTRLIRAWQTHVRPTLVFRWLQKSLSKPSSAFSRTEAACCQKDTLLEDVDKTTGWERARSIADALLAGISGEPDLKCLIDDRMNVLDGLWPTGGKRSDIHTFAIAATDFYDELGWIASTSAEPNTPDLGDLRSAILQALSSLDITLIARPEWDPTLQRAIMIEQSPAPLATPEILRSGRSGIAIGGEILRKQEVVLLSP